MWNFWVTWASWITGAFLIIVEIFLAIVVAAFITTQILWPALTKQPLFPILREHTREKA